MKVTREQVENALSSFEEVLSKSSDNNLDQPEGADLGNPAKEKMSDAAKGNKEPKMKKAKEEMEEQGEELDQKSAKKSDGHVDEEETHSDHKKSAKSAKKSFSEELPEEIQTKIDVSEFLKSLVDHTGDCLDELTERVVKSEGRIAKSNADVMDAVEDLQKSQAKIGIVLKAICQRIGIIENAPAQARKSEAVAKSGAQDRKFNSGLEEDKGAEPIFKSLSDKPHLAKAQMSEALCSLVRKGEAQDLDVIGFETNGFVRPELMPKLKAILN